MNSAYWAGLFDGEGCVSVVRCIKHQRYVYYTLECRIVLTHQPTLQLVQNDFGGCLGEMNVRPRHKRAWQWYVRNDRAQIFVQTILPFSFYKRPQLELGLAFQRYHSANKGSRSDEKKTFEESAWREMKVLKAV